MCWVLVEAMALHTFVLNRPSRQGLQDFSETSLLTTKKAELSYWHLTVKDLGRIRKHHQCKIEVKAGGWGGHSMPTNWIIFFQMKWTGLHDVNIAAWGERNLQDNTGSNEQLHGRYKLNYLYNKERLQEVKVFNQGKKFYIFFWMKRCRSLLLHYRIIA